MSEITEDILDGSCCQFCQQYFKHPTLNGIYVHDYPVVCWDCWEKDLETEFVKAEVETF
jgi:hypothetical protein